MIRVNERLSKTAGTRVYLNRTGENAMQVLSLVWGILALVGVLVAFTPFLGALNWLLIPFAVIGAVVSAIVTGMAPEGTRGKSMAGLICCGIAAIFGFLRLVAGLGLV